jgi:hypothetical protein
MTIHSITAGSSAEIIELDTSKNNPPAWPGYFTVERAMLNHPYIISNKTKSREEALIWLLKKRRFSEKRFRADLGHRDCEIHVRKNQLSYSYSRLAKEWGWTERRVETFLKNLEGLGFISLSVRGQTIITICDLDPNKRGTANVTAKGTAKSAISDSNQRRNRNDFSGNGTADVTANVPTDIENNVTANNETYKDRPPEKDSGGTMYSDFEDLDSGGETESGGEIVSGGIEGHHEPAENHSMAAKEGRAPQLPAPPQIPTRNLPACISSPAPRGTALACSKLPTEKQFDDWYRLYPRKGHLAEAIRCYLAEVASGRTTHRSLMQITHEFVRQLESTPCSHLYKAENWLMGRHYLSVKMPTEMYGPPAPPPKPQPPQDPATFSEEQWRKILSETGGDTRCWRPSLWGPNLDETGCLVPEGLLIRYGFREAKPF